MRDKKNNFVISKEDWSLHRKGFQDQERHMEKVKEAIKKNLPDLITEESIILSNGQGTVKIPIRSLDEFKIRYNFHKAKHVGQGSGDSEVGDVLARDPAGYGEREPGKGEGAGDKPGHDYYETEVSFAELEKELFRELALPNLEQKDEHELVTETTEFNDIRKQGLIGNLDKKRTILEALKRNAMRGKAEITPIHPDDLRFKTWNDVVQPDSRAVVIAMMDTSGSMGNFEKYMARSFFFWMTRFLRTKYEHVDIQFIAHHTEAKVVTEEDFFTKGESGGTMCSSAYEMALQLIKETYDPQRYNIYPFHFSDGDNLTSDNRRCLELVAEIMERANMFGYGEVNAYSRHSTLMSAYKRIEEKKFKHYILKEKKDVYFALKHFFKQS